MKGNLGLNRWGALMFVGMAMLGAVALVGTEENSGALLDAAEQLGQQTGEADSEPQPEPSPAPVIAEPVDEEPALEFASDEDLMVDPTGFDPTPVISDPAEGEEVVVETVGEPGQQ